MDEILFCFGGPSDSGDTGGPSTQDAQMNELDQISADFDNMSQQQAAGESVTSGMAGGVGRGGSSNDNDGDGIPNSIDATPGVDRSSIGAAAGPGSFDAFDASKSYLDQAISNFAAGPGPAAGSGDSFDIGYQGPINDSPTDMLAGPASNLGPQSTGFRVTPATIGDVEAQLGRAAAASQVAAEKPEAEKSFVESVAEALGLSTPTQATGIATLGPSNNISRAAGLEAARNIQGTRTDTPDAVKTASARGRVADRLSGTGTRDLTPGVDTMTGTAAEISAFAPSMTPGARATSNAELSAALGPTALSYDPTEPEAGAIDVQSVINEAKANTQQSISSGAPTPSTVESAAAMEDINIAAPAKAAPSNIDQETGLPVSVRQANAPTFGEVPNYDETDYLDLGTGQDLISARQAAVDAAMAQMEKESPINTGIGIVDTVYNSIMAPNTTAYNMVTKDGANVAYDITPEQNVIGVVDRESGNIQPTSGNFFNTELNPYYDQYGRGPEGGGDGGSQTTMPAEVAPVAPQTCPDGYTYDASSDSCVYQGQNVVQTAQYGPAPAPSYNYTGLPSLAPTTLQPSFQARGSYGPLFNFR